MSDYSELLEMAEAAGLVDWKWWTSNSVLRLTTEREGRHGADGDAISAYRDNVQCPEAYRSFIEKASPAAVGELATRNKELAGEIVAVEFQKKILGEALKKDRAEIDRLKASLSAPESVTADPAADYDALRKQFLALRTLANSNARMVSHWRNQCGTEAREAMLTNAANVSAERDTNQMLSDALLAAEDERDQLKAEVEQLTGQLEFNDEQVVALEKQNKALIRECNALRNQQIELLKSAYWLGWDCSNEVQNGEHLANAPEHGWWIERRDKEISDLVSREVK